MWIIHNHSCGQLIKKIKLFASSIKILNLLKSELRSIAKSKSISGYKSMSKKELINAINISKPTKNKEKREKR